jgi:hypothetical protein
MARVAVVGNVSRDVVDGGSPTPGGCPEFAAAALRRLGHEGQIVTRFAPADARLFEDLGPGVTVLSAASTSGFALDYAGTSASWLLDPVDAARAATRLGGELLRERRRAW